MYRQGDFIVYKNLNCDTECIRCSSVSAIYFEPDSFIYIILFIDGSKVQIELSKDNVKKLIDLL